MYQGRFSPGGPDPQKPKQKKLQPSLGGTIFYTLYFFFILLFCAGTLCSLNWLNEWLKDYEASQPTAKAAAVFNQHFGNPKWDVLYTATGMEDTRFENGASFAAYMEQRIGDQGLSYAEAPGGPGQRNYCVRLGEEDIAVFTLENRNHDTSLFAIPDWQLGTVELFYQRNQNYRIAMQEGHTAAVNGVPLLDSDTQQITTTAAAQYLPAGVKAPRICIQAVNDLFILPDVQIFDGENNPLEVTYDEGTKTFAEAALAAPLPQELKDIALDYALQQTAKPEEAWEASDAEVSGYVRYDENHFSLRVKMGLTETQDSGDTKDWVYSKSLLFQKQKNGQWQCIQAVDADMNRPVGRVRLTFMLEDTPVSSDFYHTDAAEVITPVINTPDGKVFAGWVQHITDESGQPALELVFRPDSSGRVAVPQGQSLTPMTLYAHFETLGG